MVTVLVRVSVNVSVVTISRQYVACGRRASGLEHLGSCKKEKSGNNIHDTRPQCCSKACRFCDRTTLPAAQAVMHTFCSSALSSMVTEGIAVCLGTATAAETRCGRTAPESDLPFRARGVTAEFRVTGS